MIMRHFSVFALCFLCGVVALLALPLGASGQNPNATPTIPAITVPAATAATSAPPRRYKVVGYFPQWGMYARNYRVKDIVTNGAADKLTHINYAFANVSTGSRCYMETRLGWGDASADYEVKYSAAQSVDGQADEIGQPISGHFNQLRKLKAMYPHLKVLISIGGYTWSGRFSEAALPENRIAFVQSCIDLFIRGNLPTWAFVSGGTPAAGTNNGRAAGVFDGIDIDWEYPAMPAFPGDPQRDLPPHQYRPEDTANFTALLAEFRKQLDEIGRETGKYYELTIAAPLDEARYSKMELGKIHQYLDFINIMAYDVNGAWDADGPTNFHAPLYTSPDDPTPADQRYSVATAVQGFLAEGVPPGKIVVGVPFYGRGWTKVPNQNNGLYQSDPAMQPAPGRWEAGIDDYKRLKQLGYPSFRDPKTGAFWVFDGSTFWSYDDPDAIRAKMAFIRAQQLGGAMFWSLDGDDGTLIVAVFDGLNR
jgi:chitinase